MPPLPDCGSAPATGLSVADTLDVLVRIAEGAESELLVRVDPPGESDVVFPPGAPATVAAAALSVTSRGLYQVCAAEAPAAILFDATATPHGRAWMRVTTRRPVRARLQVGAGPEESAGRIVVLPGASGRTGPVAGR
ncbi:MAG: hypothetical protein HKP30_12310 [Myxococcales bacterium]|nr:hypothetical protein [Myxococcales bacterium]